MIISIAGDPGSGKSTLAKLLAEKLNWPRHYMGGIMREKAKEKGMTLAEFQKIAEKDPKIFDYEVDEYQKKLGLTEDNFIIEGRTSWYFIPHSLKIFLAVSEEEGSKRILRDLQKDSNRNEDTGITTVEEMMVSTKRRVNSEILRYKIYGIDVYDKKNYDYVVDTTSLSREETFDKVWEFVRERLKPGLN